VAKYRSTCYTSSTVLLKFELKDVFERKMKLYQEELVDTRDDILSEEELEENRKQQGDEYLLAKANEQGYITYDDILAAFPEAEENVASRSSPRKRKKNERPQATQSPPWPTWTASTPPHVNRKRTLTQSR
jgi:hypothetical protein